MTAPEKEISKVSRPAPEKAGGGGAGRGNNTRGDE